MPAPTNPTRSPAMLAPPRPPSRGTASSLIQQIYITHCLHNEGLSPEAGFNPRASSPAAPPLLRFAREYPPYAPPPGAGRAGPRRLALARVPGGPAALIHSVPAAGAGGRANNFFSHVLFRPALSPR